MKYNTFWLLAHSLILGYTFNQLWTEFPFDKTVRILSFYTNFNHLLVTIYFTWHLYIGLFHQNKYPKEFLQFTQFVIISSTFVAIAFWIGYSINEKIFLGRHPPPWFLLYILHGGTALLVSLEYSFFEGKRRIMTDGGQWHIYSLIFYYILIGRNYLDSGRFPYPFQKRINFWVNISGMLLIAVLIYLYYQKALNLVAHKVDLMIQDYEQNIKQKEEKQKAKKQQLEEALKAEKQLAKKQSTQDAKKSEKKKTNNQQQPQPNQKDIKELAEIQQPQEKKIPNVQQPGKI